MRILILTNPKSGPQGSNEQLARDAFRQCTSDEVVVRAVKGEKIQQSVTAAITERFDCIVAAGGDGTVNAVACALLDTDIPLGVLPLGTLNHFAKDLGMPLELADAACAISAGKTRQVDVAEVNGRLFVNNSSIGIYPHLVRHRDGQMFRLGRAKPLATLFAAVAALKRFPTVHVRVKVNGEMFEESTPFVMVGNNPYTWDLFNFGSRERLDGGELGVYFSKRTGRFGLLILLFRGWFHRLDQSRDFNALTTDELWIESRKRELRVAVDGEIQKMEMPLHYLIRPGALRVIAPEAKTQQ